METPLDKVLRLAQVQSFERRSPRGRVEHVRSFVRGFEAQKLPGEEDALRGRAATGNWAYQRNEEASRAHDTASRSAHDTASATAKATAARDAALRDHVRAEHQVKPREKDVVAQHQDLHKAGPGSASHWHDAHDFQLQTNSLGPAQADKVKVPKNYLDAGGLV